MVGQASAHARHFQHVGANAAFAFPPAKPLGGQWIRIGSETMIGPRVMLSAGSWVDEPIEPPNGWALQIGDRCSIGRDSVITSRVGVDVGDDVITGPGVYITDHNHAYANPSVPIRRQWVEDEAVRIGAGSWIGAGAAVLPGADIGVNCVIGAGAVVIGAIPDRSVAAGIPARIIRTWDADRNEWDPPIRPRPNATPAPDGWLDEDE